ncbi:MAG: hypothetical protein LBF12_03245 [Christensenellaceae bacterium]|jgi:hypothetical protein|nr:hypothetical protein [Christensenellaceae bacterium]
MTKIIACANPTVYLRLQLKSNVSSVFIIGDSCYLLAKELANDGHLVELFESASEVPNKPGIVIGIGGETIIRTAIASKEQRCLVLIPDAPFGFCFLNTNAPPNSKTKEDMIILSQQSINQNSQLIFYELFILFADINDIYSLNHGTLKVLEEMHSTIYEALINNSSPYTNFEVLINTRFKLNKLNLPSIYYEICTTASKISGNYEKYKGINAFYLAFVINLIILCFTKWNIQGIIIGNDRVRLRTIFHNLKSFTLTQKFLFPPDTEHNVHLKEIELTRIALRFKQLTKEKLIPFAFADCIDSILLSAENSNSTGMLSRLSGSGILSEILRIYQNHDNFT